MNIRDLTACLVNCFSQCLIVRTFTKCILIKCAVEINLVNFNPEA